jgi:hypothetical protein
LPPAEIDWFNSLNDSPKARRPSDNPAEMSDVRLEPLVWNVAGWEVDEADVEIGGTRSS